MRVESDLTRDSELQKKETGLLEEPSDSIDAIHRRLNKSSSDSWYVSTFLKMIFNFFFLFFVKKLI